MFVKIDYPCLAEVFTSFRDHNVRYLIIGGIAANIHGERKLTVIYQNQELFVVGKQDLIASKRASGRPKDLEDARLLELGGD